MSFANSGFWLCPSCTGVVRIGARRLPSIALRGIANSSRSSQNGSPSLEQLRAPFRDKNRSTLYVCAYLLLGSDLNPLPYRYYTLSIILGTVALSYGSVPMYKMVSPSSLSLWPFYPCLQYSECSFNESLDLPNNRLGWPAHKIYSPRRLKRRPF